MGLNISLYNEIFEHESHELHEYFIAHGSHTDLYNEIFERESHELNE